MKVDGIPGNAEIMTSAIAPSRNDGTEKNVSYLGDWATNGATPSASKGEDCHKKGISLFVKLYCITVVKAFHPQCPLLYALSITSLEITKKSLRSHGLEVDLPSSSRYCLSR